MHPCIYFETLLVLNCVCKKHGVCFVSFPKKSCPKKTIATQASNKFKLRRGCCDNCSGALGCCGDFSSDAPWHLERPKMLFSCILLWWRAQLRKMTKSSCCTLSKGIRREASYPFFCLMFHISTGWSSKRPWETPQQIVNTLEEWEQCAGLTGCGWSSCTSVYFGDFGCKVDQ